MAKIITISNSNDPELAVYAHLNESQLRHYFEPAGGLFIAESRTVIERALDAGYVPVSFLIENKYLQTQAAPILGRCPEVPVYTADLEVLCNITGYHLTRGILAAMRRKTLPSVREVCMDAARIVVLEDVENPTNVGAIFRNAAGLSMDAVLLTRGCADPLYRRAIRVSVGTVFQIPWTYIDAVPAWKPASEREDLLYRQQALRTMAHTGGQKEAREAAIAAAKTAGEERWPEQGMQLLQTLGFRTAAFALRGDTISINDPELTAQEKLAVIVGNEGNGLRQATLDRCDYTVRIPMSHGVDSLNVAAASAVAFWELAGRHR